ncbi:MAG: succinylglutamate desuccinylase/aspartoacylase family protein [Candidatus Methylacidiphilales bacterium]|nr:succinylglutamate desuccinylase/aspartoacylase family protein [Candidatus Methylacidiphilales bacterium]
MPRARTPSSSSPRSARADAKTGSAGTQWKSRKLARLLEPLHTLAATSNRLYEAPLNPFMVASQVHRLPRYVFISPGWDGPYLRVGLFAAIHGDEIAGSHALVRLLQKWQENPEVVRGYELFVYPVCNPSGYDAGTRHSGHELDLNREFWQQPPSTQPEVRILEQELKALQFDGLISLHADDTSDGLYGLVNGSSLTRYVLEPALAAAERYLPRNHATSIDGFEAHNGIILQQCFQCYRGVLSAPAESKPHPFEIVFETPQDAPLEAQISAHIAAVETMLDTYRTLRSEAQNI